jgi:lipoprotein-releasing system ATP-binding protein
MIKAEKIVKTYPSPAGPKAILRSVDFSMAAGEVCAVCGPSGSGKSTLLNILGLIDRADGGALHINDRDVSTLAPEEILKFRNEKIGFVFQHHFLIPELCVWRNIAYPGALREGGFSVKLKERAMELLEFLKLGRLAEEFPATLSGGESQRIAVARSVFNAPDILIMDEPTGSLDIDSKSDVINLILALNRVSNITVVIATHDDFVKKSCGRVFDLVPHLQ